MYINVFKGLVISYIFTFLSFLIFAAVLSLSSFSDSLMPSIILVISIVSILIGSAVCSMHASSQGFIWGGIVGFLYSIILYFLSSSLLVGFTSSVSTIYLILCSILFGAIGGVAGINLGHR